MKTIIKIIVFAIVGLLIVMPFPVFYFWSFNPIDWSPEARMLSLTAYAVIFLTFANFALISGGVWDWILGIEKK